MDPAQERLLDQLLGIDVGRDDQQHVERNRELGPGVQREEVEPLLERHDPAVEQVARRHPLAAEVVDDEDAAVRLHLERRLVELGEGVVLAGRAG